MLIVDSSGRLLGLSAVLLQHSPFQNFLMPGIVLFLGNGVSSLVVFWLVLARKTTVLIAIQGSFLIAWIVAQVYFLQSFDMLHVIFGTVGILMLLCGLLLAKKLK